MTTKLSRLVMCLVLAGLTVSWAAAQDGTSDSKSKSDVRTITGCLTKGDSTDEFLLTGNDGSTWEVRGSKSGVDLASHVGHTPQRRYQGRGERHGHEKEQHGARAFEDYGHANDKRIVSEVVI
jgi:hypothetical protein